jgi:MOSC domain-containing protein YiiM
VSARVAAVSRSPRHAFSKAQQLQVRLLAGHGIEGDAHCGETVKHRSQVRKDPTQPNLRQVHLIHAELLDELLGKGFIVHPGALGENITTRGIALLDLPTGTILQIGRSAVVQVTGLRNPCIQLDRFQPGLTAAVLDHDPDGALIRKSGIMAIVLESGDVAPGDAIRVILPAKPHQPLGVV